MCEFLRETSVVAKHAITKSSNAHDESTREVHRENEDGGTMPAGTMLQRITEVPARAVTSRDETEHRHANAKDNDRMHPSSA